MRVIPIAAVIAALITGAAAAKTPIRDVAELDDGVLFLAIAIEIDKVCPDISIRTFSKYRRMLTLSSKAKSMGYTDADIKEYRKSSYEKKRRRAKGEAYMRANGMEPSKPETLCLLGEAEIDRSSAIGVLLRMR